MFLEGETTRKAIVGVSMLEDVEFSSCHMGEIINKLKKLEIEGVNKKDFKNVYLVIRSKEKDMKFCINDAIMRDFKNATTVVTPGATFNSFITVNGNNLTVDISNTKCNWRCKIDAQNSQIDLSGCNFNKIIFGEKCSNLKITVNNDEVDKFYQKCKDLNVCVFESINGSSWEEFKINKEEERKKKEEEEQQQDTINNNESNDDNSDDEKGKHEEDNGINNDNNNNNTNGNNNSDDEYDDNKKQQKGNKESNDDTTVNNSLNVEETSSDVNEKEEGSKIKKVLKYGSIFGGIVAFAVVVPIITFKDKIKSLFSSKKIIKTPACKVKTSAV